MCKCVYVCVCVSVYDPSSELHGQHNNVRLHTSLIYCIHSSCADIYATTAIGCIACLKIFTWNTFEHYFVTTGATLVIHSFYPTN